MRDESRAYVNPARVHVPHSTIPGLNARDPVRVPEDPVITAIMEKALCYATLGHNCFVLTNVYGHEAEVPYSADVATWERIAYGLLDRAMTEAK